eukprot:751767-Hanusia_phi.AAC.1
MAQLAGSHGRSEREAPLLAEEFASDQQGGYRLLETDAPSADCGYTANFDGNPEVDWKYTIEWIVSYVQKGDEDTEI